MNENGYSYSLFDNGPELKKTFKYYQLKKIEAPDVFTTKAVKRERPMSNKERRSKRELEELAIIPEPNNKDARFFKELIF